MAPGRDIERLHEDLEELFAELWRGPRLAARQPGFRPHVDVYRTEEPPELHIVVELAGVDPEEVEIVVAGQDLVLSGLRRRPGPDPACRPSYYQMEIEHGPFARRVRLPDDADASQAKATYTRGLLTVVLPIAARPPRSAKVSIPVRAAR
jgi:HSP20 family protein